MRTVTRLRLWSSKSAFVKVFGCRPMMMVPRTPGPASTNLQGRNPREVGRSSASDAMGFSALVICCPACVEQLFGKRSKGWRAQLADRDRQYRRRTTEIDRRGGCPGRRDGEHGHGRSRAGEVQHWNVAANLF